LTTLEKGRPAEQATFVFNERTGEMQFAPVPPRPAKPAAPIKETAEVEEAEEEEQEAPRVLMRPRVGGKLARVVTEKIVEQAAQALGWPVEDAHAFSILTLAERVAPVAPHIAAELRRIQGWAAHINDTPAEFPKGFDAPCERCGHPRLSDTERLCFSCEQEAL